MRDEQLSDELPCVPFLPWRCPSCGEGRTFTYGKRGRIRYHRCQRCQKRFRSLQLEQDQLEQYSSGDELLALRELRKALQTYRRSKPETPESARAWSAIWEALEEVKPSRFQPD